MSALICLISLLGFIANPARLSDMAARSGGNDLRDAYSVAHRIFARVEQVQVLRVRVDRIGDHRVAYLQLSGVKMHGQVDIVRFLTEIKRLALDSLGAAPLEEVDIEVTVPSSMQRGIAVVGENGVADDVTVFTITVRHGENYAMLTDRLRRHEGVYWDPLFYHYLQGQGQGQ